MAKNAKVYIKQSFHDTKNSHSAELFLQTNWASIYFFVLFLTINVILLSWAHQLSLELISLNIPVKGLLSKQEGVYTPRFLSLLPYYICPSRLSTIPCLL